MVEFGSKFSFSSMMTGYITMQDRVVEMMKSIGSSASQIQPGKFIYLQFAMSQVAQVGQSVSNVVSTMTSVISNAVRNLKTQ